MTNKLKFSAISNRGKQLMYTEARNKSWEMQANEKKKKKTRKVRRVSLTKGSSHQGHNLKKQRPSMKNGQTVPEWSERSRTETIDACM